MQVRHTVYLDLCFSSSKFRQRLAEVVFVHPSFQNVSRTHHAWVGELSATSPWLCGTFVAVRKLHVWRHGVSSS